MSVPASALYGGILTVLLVFLALNVSRVRGQTKIYLGHEGNDALTNAVRAHGNAAEFIPIGLLILLIAEISGAHPSSMHGLGGSLLIARIVHAHGMLTRTNATRIAGSLLNTLVILATVAYVFMLRF